MESFFSQEKISQLDNLKKSILINKEKQSKNQNKNHQRLIPLTYEIIMDMIDFNGSNLSLAEKTFYNTFSISCLVRTEVKNILHDLAVTDHFIRKEEIDELIDHCLTEKITLLQENNEDNSKTMTISGADSEHNNREIEVTVEMVRENDKSRLIVENFQILEQRLTNLEERISTLLQTIPKLRQVQAKKFKINTEAIKEELRHLIVRIDNTKTVPVETKTQTEDLNSKALSLYDTMYYEYRQHAMNMLNYKKSKVSMELNERPCLNPLVKPVNYQHCLTTKLNLKQKPTFIN